MAHDLEANKKNAVEFYRIAYMGKPIKAVQKYVGTEYIQHNPDVENGKDGFIDYFDRMASEYPKT
jgi:predicted SnoaL-like aldol condensation-catalyzing enzyme